MVENELCMCCIFSSLSLSSCPFIRSFRENQYSSFDLCRVSAVLCLYSPDVPIIHIRPHIHSFVCPFAACVICLPALLMYEYWLVWMCVWQSIVCDYGLEWFTWTGWFQPQNHTNICVFRTLPLTSAATWFFLTSDTAYANILPIMKTYYKSIAKHPGRWRLHVFEHGHTGHNIIQYPLNTGCKYAVQYGIFHLKYSRAYIEVYVYLPVVLFAPVNNCAPPFSTAHNKAYRIFIQT